MAVSKVLTIIEIKRVLKLIEDRRHPEKNATIVGLSNFMGLSALELSLLQVGDVCSIIDNKPLIYQELVVPEAVSFRNVTGGFTHPKIVITSKQFDAIIDRIADDINSGTAIIPQNYYPAIDRRKFTNPRTIPMTYRKLRSILDRYLKLRISTETKETDFLLITQKGGNYSANTIQEHISLIYRDWANLVGASSQSGPKAFQQHKDLFA